MRHKLCLNHSELTEISNFLSTFEGVNFWSDLLKDKFWFFENPKKRLYSAPGKTVISYFERGKNKVFKWKWKVF